MKIGVIFAASGRQIWLTPEVPDGTTVKGAIERSGILQQCPEIDLEKNKVGIFGKVVALDSVVEDGTRIEIYRPITADPKKVPRRAAATKPAAAAKPAG
ncbi:MAG: RnfH family protein [Alphaproteobacteria bacterium]|nr:RnfH family protein [Alphaproteobacteria bacterium]